MTVTEYLATQRRGVLLGLGTLLFVLIAGSDYFIHIRYVLEFSPFYLVPISFFTWFIGKRVGFVTVFTSLSTVLVIRLRAMPPATAYGDGLIWLVLYLSSVWMIAQLKKLYERERHLSRIDPLTLVQNRRAFFESAASVKSYSDRHNLPVSIAYLDLDDFKQFNDHFGHATGDKLLAATAAEIRKVLRPTDVVARIGGDEFAILLPETAIGAAQQILDRVRLEVNRVLQEKHWQMTLSIGLVSFSPPLSSVSEMMQSADEVMYAAKNLGKNRVEQRDIAV